MVIDGKHNITETLSMNLAHFSFSFLHFNHMDELKKLQQLY